MIRYRTLQQWFFPHAVYQDARDFFAQADGLAQGTFVVVTVHAEQLGSHSFVKPGWRLVDVCGYDDGHTHLMMMADASAAVNVTLPDEPDTVPVASLMIGAAFHHQGKAMIEFAEYHEREHPDDAAMLWLAWYGEPGECPLEASPRRRVVRFAPEAYSEGHAYAAMIEAGASVTSLSHIAWLHFTARVPRAAITKAEWTLANVPNHSVVLLRDGVGDTMHNVLGRFDAMAYAPMERDWPTPHPAYVAEDHLGLMSRKGLVPLVVFVSYEKADSTQPGFPVAMQMQRDAYVERLHGKATDQTPAWKALARPVREYPGETTPESVVHVACDVRQGDAGLSRLLNAMQATAAHPERVTVWLARDEGDGATYERPDWCTMTLHETDTRYTRVTGTGPRLAGACLSMSYGDRVADGDVVLFANSDLTVETLGWDDIMRRSVLTEDQDGPTLFVANDGEHRGERCRVWWLSGATARALDWCVSEEWEEYQGEFVYAIAGLFIPPRAVYFEGVCMPWAGQRKLEARHVMADKGNDIARMHSRMGSDRATAMYLAMRDGSRITAANLNCERKARGEHAGARALVLRMDINPTSGTVTPKVTFDKETT